MTSVRRLLLAVPLLMGFTSSCLAQGRGGNELALMQAELPGGIQLHYVRVPLGKYDVRVLAAGASFVEQTQQVQRSVIERTASGYSLQDYLRRFRALAVLSGGYIDSYSPPTPLGLVRSNGLQISALHQSWLVDGFFCAAPGRAEITPVAMDPVRRSFRDCVQSGPLMLLNNKVPEGPQGREEAARYRNFISTPVERTFICLTGNQEAILGITDKVELPKLVSTLQQPEFGCTDAIGMTGAASGGMRFGDRLVGNDELLFPSVIAAMPGER